MHHEKRRGKRHPTRWSSLCNLFLAEGTGKSGRRERGEAKDRSCPCDVNVRSNLQHPLVSCHAFFVCFGGFFGCCCFPATLTCTPVSHFSFFFFFRFPVFCLLLFLWLCSFTLPSSSLRWHVVVDASLCGLGPCRWVMKFKATVRDQRTLASVCQACRGIQRRCVIKLHPTRIRFFTSTQFADGMQVWAGCRTQAILSDFQSQSQLQENAIFCEVADISQIFYIMRQAERCPNVTIKLTKNAARRPALRVSMQGVRPHLDISHDVPVRVLSELEVWHISAPPLESEVVQIVLPCLTELSKFVDKVRSTSCDCMTFTVRDNERADGAAATSCTLVVLAECFLASFALKYSSVQKCEREGDNDADFDGEGDSNGGDNLKHRDDTSTAYASVSVEVRRFARFLAIKEATPLQVVLHLVDGKAVVL
ncbi:hypothetical protein ECC02_009577, partial [Trypanosoma cruzi]